MSTFEHILLIIGLLVLAGLLGGWVNYLLPGSRDKKMGRLQSLVLGLGASAIVPVFLGMVSSDILSASKDDPYKLFYFFGICVVAAISSRAFIRTITDRLLREIKEDVDEVKSEMAPIIDRETEGESISEPELIEPVDAKFLPVLKPFVESQYTLRSLIGVASEASMPPDEIQPFLDELVLLGHLVETRGKRGRRWYVTKKGKQAYTVSRDRVE